MSVVSPEENKYFCNFVFVLKVKTPPNKASLNLPKTNISTALRTRNVRANAKLKAKQLACSGITCNHAKRYRKLLLHIKINIVSMCNTENHRPPDAVSFTPGPMKQALRKRSMCRNLGDRFQFINTTLRG